MSVRRPAGGAGWGLRPRTKSVMALVAALAMVAGMWAGALARQPQRALDHQAVVQNGRIVGSAFLIAADVALTNAHVVVGLRAGEIVLLVSGVRGATVRARVIAISPLMDLALLRTPPGFAPVVAVKNAPARVGLAVRGAGVDAGGGGASVGPRLELTGSVIAARADLGAFGPGLIVSMPGVRPGFSGGPVIDADGRLVGMITAIRPGGGHVRGGAASGFEPPRNGAPDEAYVLRAEVIRAEAERLLRLARE